MKQSVYCEYHGLIHDVRDVGRSPLGKSLDHLHELEVWFARDDTEIVECVVCGGRWGAA